MARRRLINNLMRSRSFAYSPRVEPIGYAATAIAAYVLGSIPTGFLAGKAKGIDIRKTGSGNIGATNVTRALGKKIGVLVLIVDTLKGFLACRLVPLIAMLLAGLHPPAEHPLHERLGVLAGVCAILGHNYTCWLKFKGGKGIATTCGVLLALMPIAGLICIGAWLVFLALTRYVSIASIAAAVAVPISAWLTGRSSLMIAVALTLGTLAIFKHKDNIHRLIAGTEQRIGSRKPTTSERNPSQ